MAEEKGIMDEAVDIMKERAADGLKLLNERYKGVRAFRVPKVPVREQLYHYLNMSEMDKMMARQTFGDVFDKYEQNMENMRRKYNGR